MAGLESLSEDIDSPLGLAGSFLPAAFVMWVWAVQLDASEREGGARPEVDSAAWAARAAERRRGTGGKGLPGPGGGPGGTAG
ncbi:hypothetical protein AB0D46_03375 [Streptomyces sp. NPDC048383]|uniref:hypothetical protein n=1 Tax=Streptomyces sp. NPDC048383 TaxID=3155386 RepID=UPI003425DF18